MDESGIAFNFVDVLAAVYLAWGLIRGFRRGLSRELAGLITMVVAVVGGWRLYRPLGERMAEVTRLEGPGAYLAAFVVALLALAFAMTALRWILRNLAEFAFKPPLERLGGSAAGLFRCGLVVIAAIAAGSLCPIEFIRLKFTEDSVVGRTVNTHLLPAYEALADLHPELALPGIGRGEDVEGEANGAGRDEGETGRVDYDDEYDHDNEGNP